LPYNGKARMLESYKYQISCDMIFKNSLWDKIIKNKISNQANVLKYANKKEYKTLLSMINEVKNGDKFNIEAKASQQYWKSIFYESFNYFTRNMDDIRNSCLNYGYAIIRSIIANTLSCKGFVLYDGIHHKNELNQFNLVDDIIEPFRPFVDIEVYEIFENDGYIKEELDSNLKKRLLQIVDVEVNINNQKYTLINAVNKYCDNIYYCFKYKNIEKLIEIKF